MSYSPCVAVPDLAIFGSRRPEFALELRGLCKALATNDDICCHAAKEGLLCAAARGTTESPFLVPLLGALRMQGVDPLDSCFRRFASPDRMDGCALAWALDEGNAASAQRLIAARRVSRRPSRRTLGRWTTYYRGATTAETRPRPATCLLLQRWAEIWHCAKSCLLQTVGTRARMVRLRCTGRASAGTVP